MSFFSSFDAGAGGVNFRIWADFYSNRREESEREKEDERALEQANTANDTSGVAKVLDVDFRVLENAAKHRCDKYELVRLRGTPVLRRGGNFSIDLKMNREVDLKKKHMMKLYFNFGSRPNVHNGTQAILVVTGKTVFDKSHEDWDVRVVEDKGKLLTLQVQISTAAPVGSWTMAVELKQRDVNLSVRQPILRLDTVLYVLFNPWNKNDTTYMPEEDRRKEYVLNDVGKIWVGGRPPKGRHWVFGQYDDVVLPACVVLLERSGIRPEARGDPVLVSRAISKVVNSNDENGVLVGEWGEHYPDGTPPNHWTGSIKILEEYMRRRGSVKYGQCWVFAGVTTTVCRALGLASRPVTNIESAHDTDVSLTIDKYYDGKGSPLTGFKEFVWNFHVWNDVWMERPDLPPGYGGWQAIDATPQETSDGLYQCGPASHEAIRRGQTEFKYDVPYVLAEVNADVVHWQEDPEAQDGFKILFSNKTKVGRMVLTKKIAELEDGGYGRLDHEDCTSLYKAKEGTTAERVTLHAAASRFQAARRAYRLSSLTEKDVRFTIRDIDNISIGQDFTATVEAENTGNNERTVTMVIKASSTYYRGAFAHRINEVCGEFILKPKQSHVLTLPVPYSEYYDKLVEHAMIKVVAHGRVKETSYSWVGDDCFQVIKPDLTVEILDFAIVGRPIKLQVSFVNPMPRSLHDCVLVIDGPGLMRPKTIPISDVSPYGEMKWQYNILPRRVGEFVLVTTFNSTELVNLTGSTKIRVSEK